jgi:hypothetical protein
MVRGCFHIDFSSFFSATFIVIIKSHPPPFTDLLHGDDNDAGPEDNVFARIQSWAAEQHGQAPADREAPPTPSQTAQRAREPQAWDTGSPAQQEERAHPLRGERHASPAARRAHAHAAASHESRSGGHHESHPARGERPTEEEALRRLAQQVSGLQSRVQEVEQARAVRGASLPPLDPLPQSGTFSAYAERLLQLVDRLASYLTDCEEEQHNLHDQVVRLTGVHGVLGSTDPPLPMLM